MFDSLTVYNLRICAFEVVDLYGTGTIDLFDNIGALPFRENFPAKNLKREFYSNT